MLLIIKQNFLPITVFITGACVLVVEIVATRILSPFYGNTIFTVSSIISVILAALSVGYYAGGKLADSRPSLQWFFSIILSSGLVLLFFHAVGLFILPTLGYTLPVSVGPLTFSMILFFTPAFLLGTLSPYAVKLQSLNSPEQGIGSVSGKIFFWSTLGSIIGSLMTGFIFIPHFGINQIMIATSGVLFFLGFIPLLVLKSRKVLTKSLIALLILVGVSFYVSFSLKEEVVYSKDGVYEKITIYDGLYKGRPARFFQQDASSSGAMFLDSDDPKDLLYDYTKYYSLYKIFNPKIEKVLVIGGGAYSIPKAMLAEFSTANVDVSEIEPSLYDLAQKYFGVENSPRLHNYTTDGRRLLHDSKKNYNFIFSDVYYSLFSVPVHFTTQEFFKLAKSKLDENGIFMANMIGNLSPEESSLIMSEIRTFQTAFSNSYFFAVKSPQSSITQNIIFVGYNSDKHIDFSKLPITTDLFLSSMSDKIIDIDKFDLSKYPILTDNYSPVEHLTNRVLKRVSN